MTGKGKGEMVPSRSRKRKRWAAEKGAGETKLANHLSLKSHRMGKGGEREEDDF